ncbi:MAG: RNA pseudouridine synthase [Bacteroidales bacterium]|jgi:tRNA pseudouridine32 synthase/23S rRNA pseudouridine746 synthase|nr:RNA pseudouridine synthase [Bacteroidales bacterium]
MFHKFLDDISKIAIPEQLNCPTNYTPHPLAKLAASELMHYLDSKVEWAQELQSGKMFGVLVVERKGELGFLAAFSGNICGQSTLDYFVPPIFDCQNPNGTFKREERNISIINQNIDNEEHSREKRETQQNIQKLLSERDIKIATAKEVIKRNKAEREARRLAETLTSGEAEKLIRESQHEKAELHRLKLHYNAEIAKAQKQLQHIDNEIQKLKNERHRRSIILQRWLFSQYVVSNGLGSSRSIGDIFRFGIHREPPSGTGECAAPKLLQFAIRNNLKPISLAEFWYGNSPRGVVRQHGAFYPACHQKCEPLLNFMLEGIDHDSDKRFERNEDKLEIIYEDKFMLAINKPSGLASVDGNETADSAEQRISRYLGHDGHHVVHRLDMETSGVLIAAKDEQTFTALQTLFEQHKIRKTYIAVINGYVTNIEGIINIPICPDMNDRPRQMVDYEHGKQAITKYIVLSQSNGRTRVEFQPLTGRTHQLRVHSVVGLGYPIVGDNLYGANNGQRLMLHAYSVDFIHPITNQKLAISCDAPF